MSLETIVALLQTQKSRTRYATGMFIAGFAGLVFPVVATVTLLFLAAFTVWPRRVHWLLRKVTRR